MPYDVVAYEADDLAMQLNEAEEGLFHRMLRRSWMNGSIPADLNALASICRTHPAKLKKAWIKIAPLWKPQPGQDGRLINLKQESERAWVEAKSTSAQASAEERWDRQRRRHQGGQHQSSNSVDKSDPRGNFTDAKQHHGVNSDNHLKTQEVDNANALPSQSERNASPSPPLPLPVPSSLIHDLSNNQHSPHPPSNGSGGDRRQHLRVSIEIPADFSISDANREWFQTHDPPFHFDMVRAHEQLVAWALAGAVKKPDWSKYWRTWMLNPIREREAGNGNGAGQRESEAEARERRTAEATDGALRTVAEKIGSAVSRGAGAEGHRRLPRVARGLPE